MPAHSTTWSNPNKPSARILPLMSWRDEAEVARRAEAIGRAPEELRARGLAGSPAEVVDTLGRMDAGRRLDAVYLQLLDLADLDHLELVAAEVVPQLA